MALRLLKGTSGSIFPHSRVGSRDQMRSSFHPLQCNDVDASLQPLKCVDDDVEAPQRVSRQLLCAAEHTGPNEQIRDHEPKEVTEAKKAIAEAKKGKELLKLAVENVKPEWLGEITELSGNIYRIAAFGRHKSSHLGEFSIQGLKAVTAYIGFLTVWIVQVIGPPAICLSTVFAWGIVEKDRFLWERFVDSSGIHIDYDDWHHIALTKFLSMWLICCFCLNATYTLLSEVTEWQKVDDIFRYLQELTPGTRLEGEKFLFIGGLTNCWVVLWCCIDAYICIGGSMDPKDCIMDSLALIFLFNLDDIGGALGFVSQDAWPGGELGWVHRHMVTTKYVPEGKEIEKNTSCCVGVGAFMIRNVFRCSAALTGTMSFALPMLTAVTPWRAIMPD